MELKYGYKKSKITEYLGGEGSGLRSRLDNVEQAFTDAAKTIETACNANWTGKAKEKFVEALKSDVGEINEQIEGLYTIMSQELNGIAGAMSEKDSKLIS